MKKVDRRPVHVSEADQARRLAQVKSMHLRERLELTKNKALEEAERTQALAESLQDKDWTREDAVAMAQQIHNELHAINDSRLVAIEVGASDIAAAALKLYLSSFSFGQRIAFAYKLEASDIVCDRDG